jgi:hypothetical protein
MLVDDAGEGERDRSRLGLDHDILTSIFCYELLVYSSLERP